MKFDYLNLPGYTNEMVSGVSTPTGFGRKPKKQVKCGGVIHPQHEMYPHLMHPQHAMYPHLMHPQHVMYPPLMEGGAKKRGRKPKHAIGMVHPLATHPSFNSMHGGAFHFGRSFKHLGREISHGARNVGREISHGAKEVGKIATPIVKDIAKQASSKYLPQAGKMLGALAGESIATAVGQPELAPVLGSYGSQLGSKAGTTASQKLNQKIGSAMYRKKPSVVNKRGEIVKKVMKEHGMNLPQASAFVKAHGLYIPKHA
jgi:hypothetical protein